MIIDGSFNHERLIELLRALVQDGKRAGRKVFLILDNLGVHHCKPVKAWIGEHQADIEVFFLPSYSPELNPDERLNADLKHAIGTKVPVRTKAKLHAAASKHMTSSCRINRHDGRRPKGGWPVPNIVGCAPRRVELHAVA